MNEEYAEIINKIVVPATMTLEQIQAYQPYQPYIDYITNKTPALLYRFRSCNDRSLSALRNDELWLSCGSEMNDDFDAMLCFNEDEMREKINSVLCSGFTDIVNKALDNGLSECLSTMPDYLQRSFYDFVASLENPAAENATDGYKSYIKQKVDSYLPQLSTLIQNSIKFACFSESITSAAMWGHYADSGKGFALGYDLRNIMQSSCLNSTCINYKSYFLSPIVYSDEQFDGTDAYAVWIIGKRIMDDAIAEGKIKEPLLSYITYPCPDLFMLSKILIHKTTDWAVEKEWRLICNSNDPQHNSQKHFAIKQIPSALYLGRKISSTNEEILCYFASKKNIPVYKMTIVKNGAQYTLQPEEYKI